MDCRRVLEILDCQGPAANDLPESDLAAAEEHLASCPQCAALSRVRRQLDRRIGRALRAVEIPWGARQELMAQIARMEGSVVKAGPVPGHSCESESVNAEIVAAAVIPGDERTFRQPRTGESGSADAIRIPRRRFTKGLLVTAASLLVGIISVFTVTWLLTARWTVEDVTRELARIDFRSLQAMPEFNGGNLAANLPSEPAWQNLDWSCNRVAKGLPATAGRHEMAVYGFAIRQRHRSISGLLAVLPRSHVRRPPAAQSLAETSPDVYLEAAIAGNGDAVAVAWTSGDVVYVCLIQGGADSLELLQRRVDAPPA